MQDHSLRFWFNVMDVDNDGVVGINDIRQHIDSHSKPLTNKYFCSQACLIWTELCDLCGVSVDSNIAFKNIKDSKAGSYCFDTIIRNQWTDNPKSRGYSTPSAIKLSPPFRF